MVKVIIGIIIGVILCSVGVYLANLYLSEATSETSPLLLVPSMVFMGAGIAVLLKAIKIDKLLFKKKIVEQETVITQKKESLIERNNNISQLWTQAVEKRDKLRMLKMASAAQEQKTGD